MEPPALEQAELSDDAKVWKWRERTKLYLKDRQTLITNKRVVYNIIYGQCSPSIQEVLMGDKDYKAKSDNFEVKWLLDQLRLLSVGLDRTSNGYVQDQTAHQMLLNMRQRVNESNQAYLRRFQENVATLELSKGKHVFYTKSDSGKDYETASDDERKSSREKHLAVLFIRRACISRYGNRIEDYEERDAKGIDEYPVTLVGAFEVLTSWELIQCKRKSNRPNPYSKPRVSFLLTVHEDGETYTHGVNDEGHKLALKKDITCHRCQKKGHYADKCPERLGTTMIQMGVNCTQQEGDGRYIVPADVIILDSGSTNSCFRNKAYVKDIHQVADSEKLKLFSTGGTTYFEKQGTCNVIPIKVWFDENSLANILSMNEVANIDGVSITMDTSIDNAIIVNFPDGHSFRFEQINDGLYAYNPVSEIKSNNTITNYSFASTVKANKNFFTRDQINRADRARKLQEYIGWPSTISFKNYVQKHLIKNTDVCIEDINRAEFIYGPAAPLLQGKMTRPTALPRVMGKRLVTLPAPIEKFHRDVDLCIDYFFVNGLPFFHTISRNIQFRTVEQVRSRSSREHARALSRVIDVYDNRALNIVKIDCDNEFDNEHVRAVIAPRVLDVASREEHVGPVERSIRTIKERVRCICHSLPYKRYTKIMVRSLVESVVFWLNSFPVVDGVSEDLSPAAIVQGRQHPDFSGNKILFGAYAIVFAGTSNNMHQRGERGIALRETDRPGRYRFMSLDTGRVIHSHSWQELPIDDFVISRVHDLASREGQPLLVDGYPVLEFVPGVPIRDIDQELPEDVDYFDDDNDDDGDYDDHDDRDDHDDDDSDYSYLSVNDYHAADSKPASSLELSSKVSYDENLDDTSNDEASLSNESEENDDVFSGENDNTETGSLNENEENDNSDSIDDNIADNENPISSHSEQNQPSPRVETEYTLSRPRRQNAGAGVDRLSPKFGVKSYESGSVNCHMNRATGVLFTQMSAKKGIKKFGERAIAAMIKEFKQIHEGPMPGKPVVRPVDPHTLSLEQKKQALEAVTLIKEKRSGMLKGRTCANGKKQKLFLKENESYSSPTVSLEGLLASLVIDVVEKRNVAIFDVPGAYLHAKMPDDKKTLMVLRGDFADIMCQVNPEYERFTKGEGKNKVLYLHLLRALYGCIESALLWYNLYVETLRGMGFQVNPYDRCVANKIIKGKQCTICWYVDDNKVSHEDEEVVTWILGEISKHFGELTITRGDNHQFLGMKIQINKNETVSLSMQTHIKEAIEAYGDDVSKKIATPADRNLFTINDESEELDEGRSAIFHSVVAKLLHLSKRVRPDIEPTVAFLCTRVSKSTEQDWKKLGRVLRYLNDTLDMKRVIGGKDMSSIHTWVDAAYAVHENMRSQTGGCLSFGRGVVHTKSSKQKLNTKSSTEAELVGLSDYIPYTIWMNNFLTAQGYKIKSSKVYQDNQSAIRMEINGRNSCTGNSRHVAIRYFFVKDRVDKGEIVVEYCPTDVMLADFFTKPLQGTLFKTFRSVIMGHEDVSVLFKYRRIKERVEKDVIRTNLNSAASGTGGQSRKDDDTLKKSSESGSCGDDTLKRSYRSVLIGRGK